MLLLYRRILKAAAKFPSIKRGALIDDIKHQFKEHKACCGCVTGKKGAASGFASGSSKPACSTLRGTHTCLPPWCLPALLAGLQVLEDPAKVRHELGVALRSLEQLESYAGMDGKSADLAVSLKGSCD